jgi:hypothetical protein
MATHDDFIGRGWSFPPAFSEAAGGAAMSSGNQDIRESLHIIFTTRMGERIMNPSFGCSLDDTVFTAMNASRLSWIENQVRTAIIYHEPRIDADSVTIRPDHAEGILLIDVGYKVRGANSRFNFVFPYYLGGG